jgi:hypothetical protein
MEPVHLLYAEFRGVAPFGDVSFPFRQADGDPRMVTVVHGGGGVGKTALLSVLAVTRPGHTTVLMGRRASGAEGPAHAVCEWTLGADDPERPHPLVIATPNVRHPGDDDASLLRRREQALFDRAAKERGGFVFLSISGARWFSKQPVTLHAPRRTVAHYDVRATAAFDDASHSDLTRETKQALAYAGIAAALAPDSQRARVRWRALTDHDVDSRLLGRAMHETVDTVVQLAGFRYEGIDPLTLEPTFATAGGNLVTSSPLPPSPFARCGRPTPATTRGPPRVSSPSTSSTFIRTTPCVNASSPPFDRPSPTSSGS